MMLQSPASSKSRDSAKPVVSGRLSLATTMSKSRVPAARSASPPEPHTSATRYPPDWSSRDQPPGRFGFSKNQQDAAVHGRSSFRRDSKRVRKTISRPKAGPRMPAAAEFGGVAPDRGADGSFPSRPPASGYDPAFPIIVWTGSVRSPTMHRMAILVPFSELARHEVFGDVRSQGVHDSSFEPSSPRWRRKGCPAAVNAGGSALLVCHCGRYCIPRWGRRQLFLNAVQPRRQHAC